MADAEHLREALALLPDPAFVLETLFAEAPVAFAIAHADGRCLAVNRVFVELFGSAPPPEYNLFRDEVVAALGLLPYLERAFAGEPVTMPAFWHDASKLQHVRVAGRPIAIEVIATPLKDRDGAVRQVAICYKDVTAERLLADERQLMRTLFEAAPEAIVVSDLATGQIEDANGNAVLLFGYPRDVLLTLGHAALSPPRQPDGTPSVDAIASYVTRARAGEPIAVEWMYRTATGAPLPCEVRLAHVPAGQRVLCRVTIVDLRERKRAEAEHERVRQLEEQNRRIRQANRQLGDFLAATAHDLRTPLNSIIGFAELLVDGRVPAGSPEYKEFTGDILAGGRHLLQLINDILDLAKIEAGKLEFRPQPMGVEATIAQVTKLLRTMARQKRITITVEAGPPIGVVELDPLRFTQVLNNFVSNALKFTPEGGRVVIRATDEPPASFRIEVEDSGIGIAPEQLARLFLDYEQLDDGAGRVQGTGLGLALTRRLVEAQGGTVGVRSTPGAGSAFFAILPRKAPAPATV